VLSGGLLAAGTKQLTLHVLAMHATRPQESPPTSTSETWVAGQAVTSPTTQAAAASGAYFGDGASAAEPPAAAAAVAHSNGRGAAPASYSYAEQGYEVRWRHEQPQQTSVGNGFRRVALCCFRSTPLSLSASSALSTPAQIQHTACAPRRAKTLKPRNTDATHNIDNPPSRPKTDLRGRRGRRQRQLDGGQRRRR